MRPGGTPPTAEPPASEPGPNAPTRRRFVVAPEASGIRLDRFLQTHAPDLSRTRLQALIATGRVAVTGGHPKASHRLRPGAEISIEVPPPEPLTLVPEAIPLAVVHEDADLVVLNKPVGLVVHPGAGHRTGTLVHALLAHCGADLSGIGGARRPGIVHRLDRGTSGLLVVAKNDRAHLALARQLKARTVERRYVALVHGRLPHAAGVVETAIGRDPRDRLRMAVRPTGAGRPALTRYRVLERFVRPVPLTLVEATLGTGRTHQIRVHLAHLGAPVVGDRTYRRRGTMPPDPDFAAHVDELGGQALHAAVLGFTHPTTGASHRFEAPPPPAFEALLAWLRGFPRIVGPQPRLR
jgi:23S rRNA pseudouridine1911/1915/1917 synthase